MQRQSALKAPQLQASQQVAESTLGITNAMKLSASVKFQPRYQFDTAKAVFGNKNTAENKERLGALYEQYELEQKQVADIMVGTIGEHPESTGAIDYLRIRNKYAPLVVLDKEGVRTEAPDLGVESVYHMYGYSKEWKDQRFARLIAGRPFWGRI